MTNSRNVPARMRGSFTPIDPGVLMMAGPIELEMYRGKTVSNYA